MTTTPSALEQAARRAALRQTLENAMDVLDLTEQNQQQQMAGPSLPSMMTLPTNTMNIHNSSLSDVVRGALTSNSSYSMGNGHQFNNNNSNGNNSNNNNNSLFSTFDSEENRIIAQARAAMIQEQMMAQEEQKRRMLANFLQSKQQYTGNQMYGDNSTSVLQALMGSRQQGMGMSKPTMPYNMYGAASMQMPQQNMHMNTFAAPVVKSDSTILHALGANTHGKSTQYVDVSVMPDPEDETNQRHLRGGVAEPFPEKLHRMLAEVQAAGEEDVVSFYSHGRAFGIHDPDKFVEDILPKYFKQSKLNSFLRQLNLYGFIRIQSGPDAGGYYHALFLKKRSRFSRFMRRVGVPVKGEDRRKVKAGSVALAPEPDFYSMKPVKQC
jgi:hypothetical protein